VTARWWLPSIILPSAALALIAAVAPLVPVGAGLGVMLAAVLAFACVGAEVLFASAAAPRLSRRALLWLLLPVSGLATVAVLGETLPQVIAAMVVTTCLLGAGTMIGAKVGNAIERPGHLLVVAIVSALVDAFSVLHPSGPTAQIIEIESAVAVMVLPWPLLGSARIAPVLGVGDIVFAALYLAACRRHRLSIRRTAIALAIGLAATFVIAVAAARGVPALPLMGAAVVIAHPEARRLPPEDRAKAAIGVAALVALFVVLFALR
jgi:hypothetical protein